MYRRTLQLSSHKITHAPKIGGVESLIFIGYSIFMGIAHIYPIGYIFSDVYIYSLGMRFVRVHSFILRK
jgi:hypothetical protein